VKGCTIYGVTVWRDCPAGNDVAQIVSARFGIDSVILFFAKRLEPLELIRRAEQHATRWFADRVPSRMRADTGFHRDFTRHYLTEKRSCLITLQILL